MNPGPSPITSRAPREVRPRRMEPLSILPVFLKLEGRRAIVAGGNEAAAWKAELLAAAGATVEVFTQAPCVEMEALTADPPAGSIVLRREAWTPGALPGAALAIGAFDDEAEAMRFAQAARAAGVCANLVDKPAHCGFQFGAIVNRSPLVVGISTDGAAPVFAQGIRARIEALLPSGFARWARAAKTWRGRLAGLGLGAADRRRFWERFTERAFAQPQHVPAETDFHAFASEAGGSRPAGIGEVTLVGAGPGDPELLTLRALRALRAADVILYDDLVSREVLDFARREAKRILVGKTGYAPSCRQDDINELMIGLAKGGKRVVRLKSGDPLLFGRAGEEIERLSAAGIPVEIVSGISAAQAAAARLKVSLTHREVARRVQFVTGHACNGGLPQDLQWAALADTATTTVIYMPRRTLAEFRDRALAAGLPSDCPAVIMFDVSRPSEGRIAGSIGELPERLDEVPDGAPCIVLIGEVFRSISTTSCVASYARASSRAHTAAPA